MWLHIEITTNGLASNVHLVGQSEEWHTKLQDRLLTWDHDKEIVENILALFGKTAIFYKMFNVYYSNHLILFFFIDLVKTTNFSKQIEMDTDAIDNKDLQNVSCGICFCVELPDNPGVPQPLCQNPKCGVYFHKNCLYQVCLSLMIIKII